MLDCLARLLHARARLVLAGTLAFVVLAGALGGPVVGLLRDDSEDFRDPASESVAALRVVERATGAGATPDVVALVRLGAPAESAQAQAKIRRVAATLQGERAVATVVAPRPGDERTAGLISRDGRSAYLLATLRTSADDDAATRLQDALEREPGVTVGGGEIAGEQVGEQVSEDLARAELLAFPILFLLSLWVFRGVVAALLPLAVGMTTILTTFLAMRLVDAGVTSLSIFSVNLVTGLGLGLAIDYSLFMVSRFREELDRHQNDVGAALRGTLVTAGRTVLFSAATVAAALASLIVFPQRFLYSMGIGGAIVALAAALVSLVALPALLAVLGPRVNALSLGRWRRAAHREAAGEHGGGWYRLSRFVMRRAAPVAVGSAALLIALGIPFLRIEFTGVDASMLPTDRSARVVDDALRAEFPDDRTSPAYAVVRAPRSSAAEVSRFATRVRGLDGVAAVSAPAYLAGDVWRIDVTARGAPLDESGKRLVEDVRAQPARFLVDVGGETAAFVDQRDSIGSTLPLALAILATTTIVILFLMTGSAVLPLKALVMNLLTLSAAFGLLVLIFQDGRLEGLLAYDSQGALELTQPVLLFAVAFGLSTDYGVFLLTRIKEARDAGAPDDEAVALGLERTGRIVTAAALLFCVAIGAFATSEIVFIKQLGVGTALAVLIDATIVRALLVPSLMHLLGRWNWWAPRPLARLHERLGLSEAPA